MRPALLMLCYGLALAWFVPAPLSRLTARGVSARLGVAAWLTAMASVLVSTAVALRFLASAAIAGWPGLAQAVCRLASGRACVATVYRSAIFELVLGLAAITAGIAVAVLAWRYGRRLERARRHTRVHAEIARVTGRKLPGADAVVLDAPQPVAYCVPGRPPAIVLTSAALAVLDAGQLTAVLAHERAHLAGRHHHLLALTRGLTASFPAVPLFTRGHAEVARLTEMCADDTAASHSSRALLVTALVAMGTGTAAPAAALAATSCAVTARVHRLLEPAPAARRARNRLALITAMLLLALASALIIGLAGHLTSHGIALS